MRISKISIKNYRNFKDFEISLSDSHSNGLVIIGETQAGKTNLIQALRLLLDPHYVHMSQEMEEKDFFDSTQEIQIEICLTSSVLHQLAGLLYDCYLHADEACHLVTGCFGLIARLNDENHLVEVTYYLGSKPEERQNLHKLPNDLRTAFRLGYLEPLRNVETELRSKINTPLRWALERLLTQINSRHITSYKRKASDLKKNIHKTLSKSSLQTIMNKSHFKLVGNRHATPYELHTSDTEFIEAIREAQLGFKLNGKQFELSRGSLGLNNALYITLKRLTFVDRTFQKPEAGGRKEIQPFTWLAIEEPEAHLHPQLQRQIYRKLIEQEELFSTIVSTHSPHLVSIADPKSLILLKRNIAGDSTPHCFRGKDENGNDWSQVELAKLKNYLQVTRAEMVFASGIIIVEGIAERKLLSSWYPELDELGISVCCIDGTDFGIYEAFLNDLNIPFVIVTDWDPKQASRDKEDKEIPGEQGKSCNSYFVGNDRANLDHIFTDPSGCTLEFSLIKLGTYNKVFERLAVERHPVVGKANFIATTIASSLNFKASWKKTDIAKGICAELLSDFYLNNSNKKQTEKFIPEYIRNAVTYLKNKISPATISHKDTQNVCNTNI